MAGLLNRPVHTTFVCKESKREISMVTTLISNSLKRPSSNIFESCENAFRLIREGKEIEAKELFPLEYYLVKKYLYLNLEVFNTQIRNRLLVK